MIRSVLTRGALLATGSFQLCGSITRIFFVGSESVQLRQSPILSIDLSRTWYGADNNSFGRERRERVSQRAWCGEGCFDSRRRVNSDVRRLTRSSKIGVECETCNE